MVKKVSRVFAVEIGKAAEVIGEPTWIGAKGGLEVSMGLTAEESTRDAVLAEVAARGDANTPNRTAAAYLLLGEAAAKKYLNDGTLPSSITGSEKKRGIFNRLMGKAAEADKAVETEFGFEAAFVTNQTDESHIINQTELQDFKTKLKDYIQSAIDENEKRRAGWKNGEHKELLTLEVPIDAYASRSDSDVHNKMLTDGRSATMARIISEVTDQFKDKIVIRPIQGNSHGEHDLTFPTVDGKAGETKLNRAAVVTAHFSGEVPPPPPPPPPHKYEGLLRLPSAPVPFLNTPPDAKFNEVPIPKLVLPGTPQRLNSFVAYTMTPRFYEGVVDDNGKPKTSTYLPRHKSDEPKDAVTYRKKLDDQVKADEVADAPGSVITSMLKVYKNSDEYQDPEYFKRFGIKHFQVERPCLEIEAREWAKKNSEIMITAMEHLAQPNPVIDLPVAEKDAKLQYYATEKLGPEVSNPSSAEAQISLENIQENLVLYASKLQKEHGDDPDTKKEIKRVKKAVEKIGLIQKYLSYDQDRDPEMTKVAQFWMKDTIRPLINDINERSDLDTDDKKQFTDNNNARLNEVDAGISLRVTRREIRRNKFNEPLEDDKCGCDEKEGGVSSPEAQRYADVESRFSFFGDAEKKRNHLEKRELELRNELAKKGSVTADPTYMDTVKELVKVLNQEKDHDEKDIVIAERKIERKEGKDRKKDRVQDLKSFEEGAKAEIEHTKAQLAEYQKVIDGKSQSVDESKIPAYTPYCKPETTKEHRK